MKTTLPNMLLSALPAGTELRICLLKASTGAIRLRVKVGRHGGDVEVTQIDEAMTPLDAVREVQYFAGENVAALTIKALDAGAGKRL